ncbi:MAG: hypothetical protein WKG07_41075 [Hymenobacter sp.]
MPEQPLTTAQKNKIERDALIYQIEQRKLTTSNPEGLVSAFQENEVSATERFKGQKVTVAGAVKSIGLDVLGSP